jgi:hypothetical protein
MTKVSILLLFCLSVTVFSRPIYINYSTYLTDKNGVPRSDIIDKGITFRLYDAKTSGTLLWDDNFVISANRGMINVKLGSKKALPASVIDKASQVWIEMQIVSEVAFSRQEVATTFYSVSSTFADTAKTALSADNSLLLGSKPSSYYEPAGKKRIDSASFSDTATLARNSLQLGGKASTNFLQTGQKVDSTRYCDTAQNVRNMTLGSASVTSTQLANNSVISSKIADSAITASKIPNNTINTSKIADGSIMNSDISSSASISGTKINPVFGDNGRLYFHDYWSNVSTLFLQGSLLSNHRNIGITASDSSLTFRMFKTPFDPNSASASDDNAGWILMRFGKPYILEVAGGIYSSSNITAEGIITCATLTEGSDLRFKTNIRPLENSIEKIDKLEPKRFFWRKQEFPNKNFPEGDNIGLIAQDVEKIYPELVTTGSDGYKAVNYSQLTAILLKAVKEQQEVIKKLEVKMKKIEEKSNFSN